MCAHAILAAAIAATVAIAVRGVSGQELDPTDRLREADGLIAQGMWDTAIAVLSSVIQQLGAAPDDAKARGIVADAYEKRALALLQVGEQPKAQEDFVALLRLDPDRALNKPSPPTAQFFEKTRKETLALLELAIRPQDATVVLEHVVSSDGAQAMASAEVRPGARWLRRGIYRFSARRPGYEPLVQELELEPGKTLPFALNLRRTSAVLFVRTVQSGVRVLVDGELRGVTEASPDSPELSKMLVVEGLLPRAAPYKIRFEKECHVPAGEPFVVSTLDLPVETVAPDPTSGGLDGLYTKISLRPSFGTIAVTADQPGAAVFIDGVRRGTAGQPITDVCDGIHDLDVRATTGRFSQRVRVEFEKATAVEATLLPTYALFTTPASPNRAAIERDELIRLAESLRTKSVRLVVLDPPQGAAATASAASTPGEALQRIDALVKQLETQGIATVARVAPDAEGRDFELTLLARGSSRADVMRWSSKNPASLKRVIDTLDVRVQVLRPTLGVETADVIRQEGAVVTAVDPDGPARGAIAAGDVIVGVGVASVTSVQDLLTLLAGITETKVNVRLRDKSVPAAIALEPRPSVINMHDDLPFNVVVSDLQARLARHQLSRGATPAAGDRLEQGIRLNLAVSLMAVGNWIGAEQMLTDVHLENRRGVSRGTVDYLRGICFKHLGRISEARVQFQRAAQENDATITEHGPAISYLASQELMQTPGGA